MRGILRFFFAVMGLCCAVAPAATPTLFINEIDYDQPGPVDTNEFVEIAGEAGSNLLGYTLEFVDGGTNTTYLSIPLPSYTFPDFTNTGWGFYLLGRPPIAPDYNFGFNDAIQNGSPDGIRLLDPSSSIVHYVSWGGAMPGATDVIPGSVLDSGSAPGSIGKTGPVSGPNSGSWIFASSTTPHFLNGGEDLAPIPEPGALPLLALVLPWLARRSRRR